MWFPICFPIVIGNARDVTDHYLAAPERSLEHSPPTTWITSHVAVRPERPA